MGPVGGGSNVPACVPVAVAFKLVDAPPDGIRAIVSGLLEAAQARSFIRV